MMADVSLLFGVMGEGSMSGKSGKLIQTQLGEIMVALNKNPLKVKVALDTDAGGRTSWSSQLQSKLNEISASGKFSVHVSKLTLGTGAISDFRNQLNAVINTLHLDKGASITLSEDGIGEVSSKMKEAGDAAAEAARKTAEFKVQIEALGAQKASVRKAVYNLSGGVASEDEKARIADLVARYERWAVLIEEVRALKTSVTPEYRAEIEAEGAAILNNVDALVQERIALKQNAAAQNQAANAESHAANEKKKSAEAQDFLKKKTEQYNKALNKINAALIQARHSYESWTAAKTGKTAKEYGVLNSAIQSLENMRSNLDAEKLKVEDFSHKFSEATTHIKSSSEAIRAAGKDTKTFSERVGGLTEKFATWFSITRVVMTAVRSVRQMITTTIELDDAMTQLRVVTHATENELNAYAETISKTAKKIGSSISDLVDSTTTYARLGYNLDESSALAEFTAMLQNVGDIDVASAQDAITSIVKAFDIDVGQIESVMDKLVITGNNFPISVEQIAEGMTNASSALSAAGNTFEQSVALLTAANTTIQNAAKSSTGLRTIAARIRNTTTELDELGETMSEASYEELVSALTRYNVSLTDMNGEFRSTYDIVADIASVWHKLTSMEQAGLATAISGTRQQAVFYSIVEQFQEASGAMEKMSNSAGTLKESYDIYMDSVTAHLNQFKAAFQSLSETTFSTHFLDDIIDFGTDLLGIVEAIVEFANALGGLKTVLIATAGVIAAIKADSIVIHLKKIASGILGIIPGLTAFAGKLFELPQAMKIAKAEGKGFSSALDLVGISASAAQLAIGALTIAVTAGVMIWSKHRQRVEENTRKMNEAANAANEERESLSALISEYKNLASADEFDETARESVKRLQQQITDLVGDQASNLDLVNGKLDAELEKLNSIKLQAAYNARDTLGVKRDDASLQYNSGIYAEGSDTNLFGVVPDADSIDQILRKIGGIGDAWKNVNGQISISYALQNKNAEEVLSMYQELRHLLVNRDDWKSMADDPWSGWIGASSQDILNNIQSQIEFYQRLVDEYRGAQESFDKNQAVIDLGETLKTTNLNTQEAFDNYIQNVRNSTEHSDTYKKVLIDLANNTFPEFSSAARQAADGASVYAVKLENLNDVFSELQSSYDAMDTARADMADSGGLSPDTIVKLASAERNYLDYLYEENGAVKLNTEAWKKNADAKIHDKIGGIQEDIHSLRERNAVLQKSIEYYKEQQALGNDGGLWSSNIGKATAEIEENNQAIADCEKVISILTAAINHATSAEESFTEQSNNVKNGISALKSAFDELNEGGAVSYSTLTSIQEKFADVSGIDDYISKLASARGKSEEAARAMGDMIDALVEVKFASEDLAKADENVIAAMLDEAGVANAAEHAHRIVADAKVRNKVASVDLKNATESTFAALQEEIQALTDEGDSADYAQNYILALRMEQILLNDSQLNMTSSIDQLIALAEVAGETASALEVLRSVQDGTYKINGIGGLREQEYAEANAQLKIQQIISRLKERKNPAAGGYSFKPSTVGNSGSGSDSSEKDVEAYIAEVDELYEKLQALEDLKNEISRENAKADLLDEDDFLGQIKRQRALISLYEQEQQKLHELADARRALIARNVETLISRGFQIDYDPTSSNILIQNMERINALTAQSKGNFDTLQEATNEYRKKTEELIDTTISMVDQNRENSDSWWDLESSIKSAKIAIINDLKDIPASISEALDEIQNVSNTLHEVADEYAANDGFITIDSWQKLKDVGLQYMQLLREENGEYVINEERINDVIAARTRQLAVENAMSYVERIKLATQEGSIEDLNNLVFATIDATNSTWGLVYAELELMHTMGDLSDSQYQAALHNVQAMQDLAKNAAANIGKATDAVANGLEETRKQLEATKDSLQETLDELEKIEDGAGDLVDYVMDMLRDKIEQQIESLENAKGAVKDYVDQLKEAMQAKRDQASYEEDIADKVKEIAKLQSKIDALSPDDSRKAQAEKVALEEELAELQKDLADTQADHATEVTEDALDKQYEAYAQEKDAEIDKLEESISSTQKLYDMAVNYIRDNWNTLYDTLINWNTEYGSSLNSEITAAWDAAQSAVERYGDFVSAIMGGISNEIDGITKQIESLDERISNLSTSGSYGGRAGGGSNAPIKNTTVGNKTTYTTPTDEEMVETIVKRMKEYSAMWTPENADFTHKKAENLANQLDQYNVHADYHEKDGTWWITEDRLHPENKNKLLYNCYHTGGFVGKEPLKPNERFIKAENGEFVMTADQQDSFAAQIEQIRIMTEAFSRSLMSMPVRAKDMWPDGLVGGRSSSISNITNNNQPIFQVTETITCVPEKSVETHQRLNRDILNEIARQIRRP